MYMQAIKALVSVFPKQGAEHPEWGINTEETESVTGLW